jgi:hypothetical protein
MNAQFRQFAITPEALNPAASLLSFCCLLRQKSRALSLETAFNFQLGRIAIRRLFGSNVLHAQG